MTKASAPYILLTSGAPSKQSRSLSSGKRGTDPAPPFKARDRLAARRQTGVPRKPAPERNGHKTRKNLGKNTQKSKIVKPPEKAPDGFLAFCGIKRQTDKKAVPLYRYGFRKIKSYLYSEYTERGRRFLLFRDVPFRVGRGFLTNVRAFVSGRRYVRIFSVFYPDMKEVFLFPFPRVPAVL